MPWSKTRASMELITPDWPAPPCVRACVTARAGGVSTGPYASLNLAAHVGDDPDNVRENRSRVRKALAMPSEPVWLSQVHGTTVVEAHSVQGVTSADGSTTQIGGIVCAVLTADCLPVLLCNRAGTQVAALHAGWRGLAGGIIESGVTKLGSPGADLLAWLGPAIGPDAFEVGDEVREQFVTHDARASAAFRPAGGRWFADIYALARLRLGALGVDAVYGGNFCTVSESRFFSYRRDRECGRIAALIWLDRR